MTKPVLLDASCILAWVFDEQGATKVEAKLSTAYITSVNISEVIDRLHNRGDDGFGLVQDLVSHGLTVVPFALPHLGSLHILYSALNGAKISLGDRCALTYGIHQEMDIWTSDRMWAKLVLPTKVTLIR